MAEKEKKPDGSDGMKAFAVCVGLIFLLAGLLWASRCNRGNIIPPDKSGISEPAK